jgi:hypothetical protein
MLGDCEQWVGRWVRGSGRKGVAEEGFLWICRIE